MKLCSDVIFKRLSKTMTVKRSGRNLSALSLNGPMFYSEGMEYADGNVYIGRVGEMPAPDRDRSCLLVAVGGKHSGAGEFDKWECFNIVDCSDMLRVFNCVQELFLEYDNWSESLWQILEDSADYAEMIRITAPLLERWVVLTDSKLGIAASCYPGDEVPEYNPLSLENVEGFAAWHRQNVQQREPFLFQMIGQAAYCFNIYNQDEYVGVISLQAENPTLTPGEKHLFYFFARFVFKAVRKTIRSRQGKTLSLSATFSDLLSCLPVKKDGVEEHLANIGLESASWLCIALLPSQTLANVPPEYICTQVEELFSDGYAVPFASHIALLLPIREDGIRSSDHFPGIEKKLDALGMRAGISYPFSDLMLSRGFYQQALIALRSASEAGTGKRTAYFCDTVLLHILKNVLADLPLEYQAPTELLALMDDADENREYWRTLKCYLDNEMNASQTARDLNIHRTTFLKRLDRILDLVDLDTPEKRLLVRICMYCAEANGYIA